jgi:hypothetical protein
MKDGKKQIAILLKQIGWATQEAAQARCALISISEPTEWCDDMMIPAKMRNCEF